MILWKAAGADDVASGATANTQRFARARFTETESNSQGSTAYLFIESLLAFVRQEDVVNLQRLKLFGDDTGNPFIPTALRRIDDLSRGEVRHIERPGRKTKKREGPPAWQGVGMRQYLWWFADAEARLSNNSTNARALLTTASETWAVLRDRGYVPFNKNNDGRWIKPWLDALDSFEGRPDSEE